MTKKFICYECSTIHSQWMGQCFTCKSWNTVENYENYQADIKEDIPSQLKDVKLEKILRYQTTSIELNNAFDGGIVPGAVHLLYGGPGCGKSSLINFLIKSITLKSLYISGEETQSQVALRMNQHNLHSENIYLLHETSLKSILKKIKTVKPKILIIDSIQTVVGEDGGSALSVLKEATLEIIKISKELNVATFIIGHVTKEGAVAGPKHLEHMVDVVLKLETLRDRSKKLLSPEKNRFGDLNRRGYFELTKEGIQDHLPGNEVSEFWSNSYPGRIAGLECAGNQFFFYSLDCLLKEENKSITKAIGCGVDLKQIEIITAILERAMDIQLNHFSVFIRARLELKRLGDEGSLAMAVSLLSAYFNISVEKSLVFVGDLDLFGNIINSATNAEALRRFREYNNIKIVCSRTLSKDLGPEISIGVQNIVELKNICFNKAS